MRNKFLIGLFSGLFVLVLAVDVALTLLPSNENRPAALKWVISFFKVLSTMPLNLIDRSYPYYAQASHGFQLMLVLVNVTVQTIVVYCVTAHYLRTRKKSKI
jgi:hypothetical protein